MTKPTTATAKGKEEEGENQPLLRAKVKKDNLDLIEDPNFERKVDLITSDAKNYLKDHLLTKITPVNAQAIVAYTLAFMHEVSPRTSYRIHTLQILKQLAEFRHPKSLKDMTRDDIILFLHRLRPKVEADDPYHKWIGTYEINRVTLLRFFKWLHAPDIEHNQRQKPDVMKNVNKITRKEISSYKPSELWTEEDDLLFCKYCTSKRDKAFHMVLRDTSARPHELLNARIKDLVWVDTDSYQVGKLMVNGKTGQGELPITRAVPYLRDWLSNGHPWSNVLDAPLFCGMGRKNTGRRLARHSVNAMYHDYQKIKFPKLLEDPLVPPEDKIKIKKLIETKRWNPYVRRHTGLTEQSKILPASVLKHYARWSPGSKMPDKYIHYFANESFNAILEAQGITTSTTASGGSSQGKDVLKPRVCFNCSEANKPDAKICSKCKYVLSYDAYQEALEEERKKAEKLQHLEDRQAHLEKELLEKMDKIERLYRSYTPDYLKSRTEHIKDKEKREEEMLAIALSEPAAVEKLDQEEAWEKEAAARAAAAYGQRNPNHPDSAESQFFFDGWEYDDDDGDGNNNSAQKKNYDPQQIQSIIDIVKKEDKEEGKKKKEKARHKKL